MELTLAIAIGVLTGSGVWLVLRPRTYQLVIGFATTALLLVVLFAARGLTGSDHVDGRESR